MLILSRRPDEAIFLKVGDEVVATVKVLGFRGRQVRLGIDAGDGIDIQRDDLKNNTTIKSKKRKLPHFL